MKPNRMYLIYILDNSPYVKKPQFYCADEVTKMTGNFSKATILDSHKEVWKLADDTMFGRFQVWQAAGSEIFKWQLKNELPSERQ